MANLKAYYGVTNAKPVSTNSAKGFNKSGLYSIYPSKHSLDEIGYDTYGMDYTSIRNAARDLALTKQIQDFNSAEALKEREWSTEMSNTSHQREVADLKAAGLNPVLSANAGANAYSGATASSSTNVDTKTTLAAQKAMNSAQVSASKYATNKSYAANMSAIKTNKELAQISAAASNYAADKNLAAAATSAAATRYASDNAYASTVYASDMNYKTQTETQTNTIKVGPVTVTGSSQFIQSVKDAYNSYINSGMTVSEAKKALEKKFSKYVSNGRINGNSK